MPTRGVIWKTPRRLPIPTHSWDPKKVQFIWNSTKIEWSEVKVLAVGNPAGGMIISTKDVSTIEGMKGAKIVPWAAMTTPVMEGMGAVPVQMDPTEHYTAISTGTIDGAISSINNIMPPWNLDEVADYAIVNTPATFNPVF